jgi:HK97 family phage major capsid protein
VLDDVAELEEFLQTSLFYFLEREFEEQLLAGSGTGQNLNGLIPQATAFDSTILNLLATMGWNYADVLRAAVLQLAEAGYGCTAFVTSPRDWFVIETMKDSQRRYLLGSPQSAMAESLWSRPVIPSPAISNGTFLVGDFEGGAHIRMRQDMTLDISDSHSDYFVKNLLALRAELRAVLVVKKPGAFVTGSFASSPA